VSCGVIHYLHCVDWPWNSTVRTDCDNYTGLLHPYSWKTPVAAATVYSAPDDGRKGRPKHVEFWHQIKSKKKNSCISLVFIWSIYTKMHGPMNIKFIYVSFRWKQAFIGYACSGCTMCDLCTHTACCVCGHSARPSASQRKSPDVQSPLNHRDSKRRANFKALSTVHFQWNVFHRHAAQLSRDKAQLWTLLNTC